MEFAWQFAQMHHRGPEYRGEMVYVGPKLSLTAANADHFIQIPAGQEYRAAVAISAGGDTACKRLSIADSGLRDCGVRSAITQSAIRNSRRSPADSQTPRMPWLWAVRSVLSVLPPRISPRRSCC